MALTPISPISLNDSGIEAAAPVTTTVAGKTYVAEVEYSAGEYIAQDPAVLGAEGAGPNAQAAEEQFTDRVSFLA